MSKFELSIFDPNTLLPHRAGIAGLALVLSTLEIDDAPISWEIIEDTVTLNWDCSDSIFNYLPRNRSIIYFKSG
ncbi:MAG: hypothetical protein ACKPCM_09545 [Pseudanabaena sp.]